LEGSGGVGAPSAMSVFNLDITYANEDVRQICTQDSVMEERFGEETANVLKERLEQIQREPTLSALSGTKGKWHPYKKELAGCIAGWISDKDRIVIKPTNNPLPVFEEGKNKGKLAWALVTDVEIVGVGNFHKKGGRK
jgi:hypothetical protein